LKFDLQSTTKLET